MGEPSVGMEHSFLLGVISFPRNYLVQQRRLGRVDVKFDFLLNSFTSYVSAFDSDRTIRQALSTFGSDACLRSVDGSIFVKLQSIAHRGLKNTNPAIARFV